MRKPKDIDDYCDVENAAKGLEDYARDLRKAALPGDRIKWSLNVRVWNDEWLKQQRGPVVVGDSVVSTK